MTTGVCKKRNITPVVMLHSACPGKKVFDVSNCRPASGHVRFVRGLPEHAQQAAADRLLTDQPPNPEPYYSVHRRMISFWTAT